MATRRWQLEKALTRTRSPSSRTFAGCAWELTSPPSGRSFNRVKGKVTTPTARTFRMPWKRGLVRTTSKWTSPSISMRNSSTTWSRSGLTPGDRWCNTNQRHGACQCWHVALSQRWMPNIREIGKRRQRTPRTPEAWRTCSGSAVKRQPRHRGLIAS